MTCIQWPLSHRGSAVGSPLWIGHWPPTSSFGCRNPDSKDRCQPSHAIPHASAPFSRAFSPMHASGQIGNAFRRDIGAPAHEQPVRRICCKPAHRCSCPCLPLRTRPPLHRGAAATSIPMKRAVDAFPCAQRPPGLHLSLWRLTGCSCLRLGRRRTGRQAPGL